MAIIDTEKINISGTYVRNLDGAKIVDGKEVEGGYFICETLPSWGTTGQLCYCTGTDDDPVNKFYQYTGSADGWVVSSIMNQNAFSNVKVGNTTVAADSITDTLTLEGSNITITPDAANDKVTFSVADGTTSAKGIVKLSSTTGSAENVAATPLGVKNAIDALDFTAPTASGNTIAFIDSVSQTDGQISATKKNITQASTSTPGIVQLSSTLGDSEDTAATPKAVKDANLFTNDTPITTSIGSINPGDDISNKTIQEVLTMMLCKYKPIEVGGTVTATASCGTYYVHQLPVLSEVQLSSVKLNSVTDAVFSLYDTSDTGTPIKTLSGQDLKNAINKTNNTLTFNSLGADGRGITIQEYKTYEIKYSYTDDKENKQTSTVSVGSYEIKFQDPTMALYNASNNQYTYDSTNSCYKLSAYNGQIVTLSDIYASISNGSARTIKKLEVFKNSSTSASITAINPTAEASGTLNGKYKLSFTKAESLTNTSGTKSTNYKVKAYYDKYNGYGTTTNTDQTIEQTLSVSFSHHNSTISLTGLSGITSPRSKLDPLVITSNTLKASLYRRSDKVATVKLLVNGSVPKDGSNKDLTGCVANTGITYPDGSTYDSAYYSNTKQDFTFSYSVAATDNICSTTKFKVGAYDASGNNICTSSEQTITFKAPYCYGFVDYAVTLDKVDANTLKGLTSSNGSTKKSLDMFSGNIKATGIGKKKFICAIPDGSYTAFKTSENSPDNEITAFEGCDGKTTENFVDITFDGDTSSTRYQIFIEKIAGTNTEIDHAFY